MKARAYQKLSEAGLVKKLVPWRDEWFIICLPRRGRSMGS